MKRKGIKGIKRRDFLKATAITGAAAALGGVALGSKL
jgi:anaerobic selenocysteine-containing dehydrogenase